MNDISFITKMVELSAVKSHHSEADVHQLVKNAKEYQCGVIQTLPTNTTLARELLPKGHPILVGGNVGFPTGGQSTAIKVAETKELVYIGCDEIDVVMNIPKLLSGKYHYVLSDIKAIVENANGLPVKVIIEVDCLDNEQIKRACDLLIEAGAAYVKTSTGWVGAGATIENIKIIKRLVGDSVKIKASGGIRDLATVLTMIDLGVSRFGIRMSCFISIYEELQNQVYVEPF